MSAGEGTLSGAVAALGNFDGVHLGHQAMLRHALAAAERMGAPAAAIVFSPHPRRYFKPDEPPFRLQSDAQRAAALRAFGLASVHALRFDAALASLSPAAFVREVLAQRFGLAGVVIGADFRFGAGRAGSAADLPALAHAAGLRAEVAPLLHVAPGEKASSSLVRAALRAGDMPQAARLLTRPWAVAGRVQEGARRGRTLGFPTANIAMGDYLRPAFGVYAVEVRTQGSGAFAGVANLGVKPTLGGAAEPLLEAHLFDFSGDLYGQELEVALLQHLRPERRFADLDALRAQIALDALAARAALQT